jgi:valyl-tRNA synthetase
MYYPTSTLVTGLDILFFWVARMIMLGFEIHVPTFPSARSIFMHSCGMPRGRR